MSRANKSSNSGTERKPGIVLERITALIGALLVCASLAFLLNEGLWGDDSPPNVHVEITEISESDVGYLVQFVAHNIGGQTAAAVGITGKLVTAAGTEHNEVTLDYVPAAGKVRGGLFFTLNPNLGQLTLRSSGYQRP